MRLIDADALIEGLLVNPEECPGCPEPEWLEDFVNTIDSAPTIEIPTRSDGDTISRQAVFNTVTEYRDQLCEIFGDENELIRVVDIVKHRLIALPSVHPDLSVEYARAVTKWLLDYQYRAAELKGRYSPYEVLSWVVNDWRKENERSD